MRKILFPLSLNREAELGTRETECNAVATDKYGQQNGEKDKTKPVLCCGVRFMVLSP